MKLDWRNALSFYQRLSARERMLVSIAAGAVLLIGLYSLVVDPLADLRERIGSRIAQKERELVEIQRMRDAYFDLLRQYETSQAVLAKPQSGFSLFSHIESTVSQVVSREHITSMNPGNKALGNAYREESVELKLTGISLKQLVDMMYRIEKGPHQLRMTRLHVKKQTKDPHSFDVTATVSMIQAREG